MPVVTVAISPHRGIRDLLVGLADAVADAVGLGSGDVIATHLPTGASAVCGREATASSAWPIVSIHGSARGSEKMDAARTAAEATVRDWCASHDVECEGVWTQWLTPLPQ